MTIEVKEVKTGVYIGYYPVVPDNIYWIGLTDLAVEGRFVWQHSFTPLNLGHWTIWGPGQPNNSEGGQDCVNMYRYGNTWRWDDSWCQLNNDVVYGLCEADVKK